MVCKFADLSEGAWDNGVFLPLWDIIQAG